MPRLLALLLLLSCDSGEGADSQKELGLDEGVPFEMGLEGDAEKESGLSVDQGSSIEERCPEAQTGTFLLLAYPDRVDAYRLLEEGARFFCAFLEFKSIGLEISSFTKLAEGDFIAGEGLEDRGRLHAFSPDGEPQGLLLSNPNLGRLAGLWPGPNGGLLAWSALSMNFYRINAEGEFMGNWEPPAWQQGSRVEDVVDLLYLESDRVVMTFSQHAPRFFGDRRVQEFAELGPGGGLMWVETQQGGRLLLAAEKLGQEGHGIWQYRTGNGDSPPVYERAILSTGEFESIQAMLPTESGLILLDSEGGLSEFSVQGERRWHLQPEGPGRAFGISLERIFPNL